MQKICLDLLAEYDELNAVLSTLTEQQWQQKSLFKNWSIYDHVEHLHFFDLQGLSAIEQPQAFELFVTQFKEKAKVQSFVEIARCHIGLQSHQQLFAKWSNTYLELTHCLQTFSTEQKLPWFGPPMSALSFISARLMETWAHGQSILDTLNISRAGTERLYYIAELGVKTFSWSFKGKSLPVPTTKPFVELTSPNGEIWQWNDSQSTSKISGSALGFCQVVTQTRNAADTNLIITGEAAQQWLEVAQCFAGKPSKPPTAGFRLLNK
ncbi:MAG: hypothetical protein ACI9LM_002219 [Alteromonadaceae bacterium]|jgi:uncharacterized protein (TIGR03084 family)